MRENQNQTWLRTTLFDKKGQTSATGFIVLCQLQRGKKF